MKSARLGHLPVEDYLASERTGEIKREYVAGQVFALEGATDTHNSVALNLASRLKSGLRGGRCRVFISDMKVRIEAVDTFYYPDVVVMCDPRDTEDYFKTRPCLIIEVASPTTAVIDRREKLLAYQKLE